MNKLTNNIQYFLSQIWKKYRKITKVNQQQNITETSGKDWAPDKMRISISVMSISSPNPMFDHLLESSHRDDSNKWSNIEFGEEITQAVSTEVYFTNLIWSSEGHRL